VVTLVHSGGGGAGQVVPFSHVTGAVPVQASDVVLWQIIPVAQSLSATHDFGAQ
jgi:hypothetical protein